MSNKSFEEMIAEIAEKLVAVSTPDSLISEISRDELEKIIRKSAYSLPTRPSASGMRAEQIKAAFYRPFTDEENSLAAEINRVVREHNNRQLTIVSLLSELLRILSIVSDGTASFSDEMAAIRNNIDKQLQAVIKEIEKDYLKIGAAKKLYYGKQEGDSLEARISSFENFAEGILYKNKTEAGISSRLTISKDAFAAGRVTKIGGQSHGRLRNLIPNPIGYNFSNGITVNGVTRFINDDGSITFTGYATKKCTTWLFLKSAGWHIGYGDFCLSGCPEGGSRETFYMQLSFDDGQDLFDTGDGLSFTRSKDYSAVGLGFIIMQGPVNFTVKPQIERGLIKTTFEPWGLKATPVKRVRFKCNNEGEIKALSSNTVVTERGIKMLSRGQAAIEIEGLEEDVEYSFSVRSASGKDMAVTSAATPWGDAFSGNGGNWMSARAVDLQCIYIEDYSDGYFGYLDEGEEIDILIRSIEHNDYEHRVDMFTRRIPDRVIDIPDEVLELSGYGRGFPSAYNFLDLESKSYMQNVAIRASGGAYGYNESTDGPRYDDGYTVQYTLIDPQVEAVENLPDGIVKIEPYDKVIFEGYDGEVVTGVPYEIKYQIKI